MNDLARALRAHSVHDPYCLLLGPDNPECPGRYVVRLALAVPEDRVTDLRWTASSLERACGMLPPGLVRWPQARTTPRPGLLEQWCLAR